MKVLLVEDNADHRELMSLALTGHDPTWQVKGMACGEEALRHMAEKEGYDLVFLDYDLPVRNGLEVLEEICRGEASPPMVMVTGRGDEQVAVEAMKAGAYDYVVKSPGYLQRLPVVAQRAIEAHQLALHHKKAEEALRESETQKKAILDVSIDSIRLVDKDLRIIWANSTTTREFNVAPEEIIGQPCYKILLDRNAPCDGCPSKKALESGKTEHSIALKRYLKGIEGETYWDNCAVPVKNESGDIVKLIQITRNITESKKAEERIKASLKEKEVLLREIHHRVKNNMQVISALLQLQAEKIEEDKYFRMFQETQDRIRSMALIHERLYKSQDLANVDFAGYVQNLLYNLFQSYSVDQGKVVLNINVGETSLGLDRAIPCGLIINELVSNSLKYAFPRQREGEIEVTLRPINENEVQLVVRDNGIGLPEDFHFQTTQSLGLRLVAILAKDQLKGEIELDLTDGTTFKIVFRAKAEE